MNLPKGPMGSGRNRSGTMWTFGAMVSLTMLACTSLNPLFDAEADSMDDTAGTGDLVESSSDGGSAGASTVDGTEDSESGGAAAVLHVFATEPSNGSLDFGRSGHRPDAECASTDAAREVPLCGDTIRAFIFLSPAPALENLLAELGLPEDIPVHSPNGSTVASSLAAFAKGPLLTTLVDAGVLPATAPGVWTGLNPGAPGNCQGWTSGNDERLGGVGALHGREGWAAESNANCDSERPILCLCDE